MDDFNLHNLTESRNEYSALLISKLSPHIFEGIRSIFKEAYDLCKANDETEKYLMTFQNFLSRVSKWNQELINVETERISSKSNCSYLEDLLSCVYINQLKILTTMRVGSKQKQIDIDIPKLNDFIHRVYVYAARRIYKNVYLFNMNASPIDKQKNVREIELLIRESILEVIRDGMPIERILRAYLDKTVEENTFEVKEEIQEEEVPQETPTMEETIQQSQMNESVPPETPSSGIESSPQLSFNDTDAVKEYQTDAISANVNSTQVIDDVKPKTIDRLEEISEQRNAQRKLEESDDDDDSDDDSFVIQHQFMKPSLDILQADTFDEPNTTPAPVKINTAPLLEVEEI